MVILIIVVGFLLICLLVGLFASRHKESLGDASTLDESTHTNIVVGNEIGVKCPKCGSSQITDAYGDRKRCRVCEKIFI